jgi:acyl-CoA synthetase (AMP-forming)/AMP-acid ligase II
MPNPYEVGLEKNAANYVPMTPIGFLVRSASVFPNRLAVAHGERRYNWREALERCRRLASALTARGIGRGDTVALMAPNIPEAFETHYGVPMAGAVLNALNIRLDPGTIAFILEHGEAKVLITDTEFSPVIAEALAQLKRKPVVIDIVNAMGPGGKRLGEMDYEEFLATGNPALPEVTPADEWDAIALNSRAQLAIRKASPTTIAAPISTHTATSSYGVCGSTRSICGPYRCFTATAGASRGRSPQWPGPMSACAGSRRRRFTRRLRARV